MACGWRTDAALDGAVRIERRRGHEFVPGLIEAFPGEIESVTVGKPTLEDAFFRWTGHRLREGGREIADRNRPSGERRSTPSPVEKSERA